MADISINDTVSLTNLTPAGAYFGRAPSITQQWDKAKQHAIQYPPLQNRIIAA